MGKILPNLNFEQDLWKNGYIAIGVDEVGRGAFAGPLFAAGVIFDPSMDTTRLKKLLSYGINDSKKLKPQMRKRLSKVIQKEALAYYISSINVAEINRIGIGKANFAAMRDVVRNLISKGNFTNPYVLVDGFAIKYLKGISLKNQKAIIQGDCISLSIAAASIIAKVARDDHMKKLSSQYSDYAWGKNKGYGTLFHREALAKYGATPFHRTDFVENFI